MGATTFRCCKPGTILENSKIEASRPAINRSSRILNCTSHGKIEDAYDIETNKRGVIASSAGGSVFRAKQKEHGTMHAVKQIFKQSFKGEWWVFELEKLKKLDHPYICKIHETWEDSKNIFLVMEYCQGGDLTSLGTRKKVNEATVAVLLRQMAGAVEHFHQMGTKEKPLVHSDIRLENWLFAEPVGQQTYVEDMCLKMIDFGIAHRQALVKGKHQRGGDAGRFVARRQGVKDARSAYCKGPEMIQIAKHERLNPATDIWSLGVIAYFMLSGRAPFPRVSGNFNNERILKGEFKFEPAATWKVISYEAHEFITSCLQVDMAARPSARELLDTRWMQRAKDIFLSELEKRPKGVAAPMSPVGERSPRVSGRRASISILDAPLPSADMMVKAFTRMNKLNHLEKVAMTAAAYRLPAGKINHLRIAFEKMDTNGDGVLSAHELYEGLSQCGIDEEELLEILKDVDSDGSGAIEYNEFITACYDFQSNFRDNVIQSVFKIFDKDLSGSVTKKELKQTLAKDEEKYAELEAQFPELSFALDEFDQDGDGQIDMEEFREILVNRHERRRSRLS